MSQPLNSLPVKIALIQANPKTLDPEFNFTFAETHIRTAAAEGARLAVLPEYHLTGWAPEDDQFAAIARTAKQYITRYQALAKELKINIVPGTILTTSNAPEHPKLLNIATFISETGDVLGSYTKTNLWHPERSHLTSGPASRAHLTEQQPTHTVIDTPLGPIGLLVCYDLFFPEGFRSLVRAGARMIIVPTFTKADDMSAAGRALNPHGEALFIRSALVTRAFENTCCVVFVNPGGPTEEGYVGLSQVAMPILGTVEGSFTDSEVGMRIVNVDMGILDVAEENYRIREDLGTEGFHYG